MSRPGTMLGPNSMPAVVMVSHGIELPYLSIAACAGLCIYANAAASRALVVGVRVCVTLRARFLFGVVSYKPGMLPLVLLVSDKL